jgi:hypothetical protein
MNTTSAIVPKIGGASSAGNSSSAAMTNISGMRESVSRLGRFIDRRRPGIAKANQSLLS